MTAGASRNGTAFALSKHCGLEYNVPIIGVNWPHHVFVNQDFKVVGAE
jgi:hypothetical protein